VDILDDGETGLLVPPENTAELAAAIGRLLEDAQLRQHLVAAGRKAAGRFALPVIAKDYAKLIENVAALHAS
jgi:glycosyltransferase involved in cell wall biosynthesis